MMHVVLFPTWSCQLTCSYCSIRNSQIDQNVKGVNWEDWAEVLPKVLPYGSIIDIAGGEPLLYDGLVDMLHCLGAAQHRNLRWALTSNLKATAVVKRLCDEKPSGGICINVSDHIGNPEARVNKLRLRQAGYRVNVHRVDHPDAGEHEPDARIIAYQDWAGGMAVDGKVRHCTAGANHWIAGPNGDIWRCIVAAQTGQEPIGNLFTRKTKPTGAACTFGCSSCYTEDPTSWLLEMREVASCTIC